MMKTLWGVLHSGKIELAEPTEMPDGTKALVTFLPDADAEFWQGVSLISLKEIWDNPEDDIYARLLTR